jgi:hypothetical protein
MTQPRRLKRQGLANDKAIDLPELWQKIHPLAR